MHFHGESLWGYFSKSHTFISVILQSNHKNIKIHSVKVYKEESFDEEDEEERKRMANRFAFLGRATQTKTPTMRVTEKY